jgi:hypothetical protein
MQLLLYALYLLWQPVKSCKWLLLLLPVLLLCLPDYALCSYQAAFRKLPGLSADVMPPAGATAAANDGPLDKLPGALATLAHAVLLLQPVLPCNNLLSTACSAALLAARAPPRVMPCDDAGFTLELQHRRAQAAATTQGALQGSTTWPAGPGGAVAAQLLGKVAASAALSLDRNQQTFDGPQAPLVSLSCMAAAA